MLDFDEQKLVPLCSQCKKELNELQIKMVSTKYYEFNCESRQYNLAPRVKVEDDNLFHCSKCGAGIEMNEIFEALNHIAMSSKKLVPA